MSGGGDLAGDPDGDWLPGRINPLHRAVWTGDGPAAAKKILDDHNVDAQLLDLRMPFE